MNDPISPEVLQTLVAGPTLNQRIQDLIREAIMSGELAPASLHSVQELASVFGVSRTPVREALLTLARQGFVRFERNRGVRILQPTTPDLEDIFVLRLLLEVPSTHRAAELMTETALDQLRDVLAVMRGCVEADDVHPFLRADQSFHRILHETAGNQRLADYIDELRDIVMLHGVTRARSSPHRQGILAEHAAILEDLEHGEPKAAAASMQRHLLSTEHLLLQQEGVTEARSTSTWVNLVGAPGSR